ncbi:F-box-like domain superfamily [Sesbania bispinosa]|nr:F-box-like domain superfamily [Sesbania bispinosa]
MKRNRVSNASARASQRVAPESQKLEPSFADLPSLITTQILLQLPIKSVLICRCVCRSWNAVISDPHFAKSHFNRSQVSVMIRTNDPKQVSRTLHLLEYEPNKFESDDDDYEKQFCFCEDNSLKPECNKHLKLEAKFKLPLRDAKLVLLKRDESKRGGRQRTYIACNPKHDKFAMVNSCNGLLCLSDPRGRNTVVVCNPITGEFINLPKPTNIEKTRGLTYAGFGFLPKTGEYKVIRTYWVFDGMAAEIHTLGTSTWRNIAMDPRIFIWKLGFPTCVNGAVHWICSYSDGGEMSILCFNLQRERFQPFPSPPHVFEEDGGTKNLENISMGELRGFLYICDASSFDPVTMWMMKKYGIGESWTKVFSIDTLCVERWPCGLNRPVKHFKKDAAVLMYNSCNCFIYYDPEEYGFKFEVIPHIPSLISLKDAVKGDNIEVQNVHTRCAKFKLREENEVLFLAEDDVELASLYSSSDGEEYA